MSTKLSFPTVVSSPSVPNTSLHAVVQARVLSVQARYVKVDREWQGSSQILFDYLVVATGMLLTQPVAMEYDKLSSVENLKKHQSDVKRSKSILIVGGGAVGVQMATDLKEYYPDKEVTVVQSRARVMPQFQEKLHNLIKKRFGELGVR
jgi:apoptosis-inducing factor 2